MLIKRNVLLILAAIALLALVGIKWVWPSVTVQTPSTPHFTVGIVGNPGQLQDLCPDGSMDRVRYLPLSAVYEGPVKFEPTRGVRPLLISDWRYTKDVRSIELVFKRNIRFHNGKELTANDVKSCWEKTLQRAASGEVVGLFAPIAGVDTFLKGQTNDIYGIQVVGQYTLRVKFHRPHAFFISSLTHPAFWIYDSQDKTALPPGTGPFTMQEMKSHTVRLDYFPQYRGESPRISGLLFQYYKNDEEALKDFNDGKINLLDEVQPEQVKSLQNDERLRGQLKRQPLMAIYSVALNVDKEPWRDNYLLRRALNYGIDRQAIVRDLFSGGALICSGPLPSGLHLPKAGSRGYTYNPELAKQLLSEAGYPEGDGLPPITLYYIPDSGYRQLTVSVAEQLGALGVEVHPRPLNKASMLTELNARRFEACLVGWQADYPEAYAFFGTIYNNSVTGYQNIQVTKLLDEAGKQAAHSDKGKDSLLKAYKIITDDAPMIWLCEPQTVKLPAAIVDGLEVNGLNQINWCRLGFKSS